MPPEGQDDGLPEGQNPDESGQTPFPPNVVDVDQAPLPESTGPSPRRTSTPPVSISSVSKLAAAAALGIAIAATTVDDKRNSLKTPRPPFMYTRDRKPGNPQDDGDIPSNGGPGPADAGAEDGEMMLDASDVITDATMDAGPDTGTAGAPGTDEDLCGRSSFARDVQPHEMAQPGQPVCEFVTDPDGNTHVIGHTLLDADGKPRDCFIQPVFSPKAAMKIRGDVSGNETNKGQLFLNKGKLCVMMLEDQDTPPGQAQERTEALVLGEASIHVMTNQRVIVKILEPEYDSETGEMKRYAMVTPVEGEVLIVQDQRADNIYLKKGDLPVKIPLDVMHNNGGCVIASSKHGDVENRPGGIFMLGAGAILLVLRRRGKGKKAN